MQKITSSYKRRRTVLAVFLSALFATSALAQVSVETQEQRRRAQQDTEERQRRQQAPDTRLALPTFSVAPELTEADALPDETPCYKIDRLPLESLGRAGTESLDERHELGEFSWLADRLAPYAGRCIGVQGINLIAQRLRAQLIARGYITARIVIPGEGPLRLVLIPGVLHTIRLAGDAANADSIPQRALHSAFPIRPGDALNLRDIEQGLEQLKRIPSQDINIDIVPVDEGRNESSADASTPPPTASDLVLTVRKNRPWRLGVTLDDAGSKATGQRQASLNFAFDNLLGINDLFSATLGSDAQSEAQQRGTRSHNLQYSLPWGYWNFSLADSTSHYHQTIQGINQTFGSYGDSWNQEIKIERLAHRDAVSKSNVQLRLLHRYTRSYIENVEIVNQRRRTAAAELGINHRRYLGSAQLDLSLAHRQGIPLFGGQSNPPGGISDGPTLEYRLDTLDASLSVPFQLAAQPLRWLAAFRSQSTRDTLYAADYLAIGNRYTVRGFNGESTLAGDSGFYLRNELELPFTLPLTLIGQANQALYAGLDHGRVSGPGTQLLTGRQLTGSVLGLRGGGHGVNYDFFAGWALNKPESLNTGRLTTGFQLGYQF